MGNPSTRKKNHARLSTWSCQADLRLSYTAEHHSVLREHCWYQVNKWSLPMVWCRSSKRDMRVSNCGTLCKTRALSSAHLSTLPWKKESGHHNARLLISKLSSQLRKMIWFMVSKAGGRSRRTGMVILPSSELHQRSSTSVIIAVSLKFCRWKPDWNRFRQSNNSSIVWNFSSS